MIVLDAAFLSLAEPAHLIAAARSQINPLTSTPLELELLKRFEELHAEHAEAVPFQTIAWEYEVSPDELEGLIQSHEGSIKDMTALLSALNDAEINDVTELNKLIYTHTESIPSA